MRGIDPLNAALITPTGNAFRNAYFKDEINQLQLKGHYDHDGEFLDSIDWGFSYVDNKVRSAYGFIQNETWGGIDPRGASFGAAAVPDDFFNLTSIPDKFKGVSGSGNPAIPQSIYTFNFEQMAELLRAQYNICSAPQTGVAAPGTCLANYTNDRRIREQTISPYIQFNGKFDVFGRPAHIIGGVRYDETQVNSSALVPIPNGTRWTGANEFALTYGANSFTSLKGNYHNWLPAVDFDIEPVRNVKLRASYSHTITRADYGSLQGWPEHRFQPAYRRRHGQPGQPEPSPLQIEEHRSVGGMVLRA
ncbi:TonB-dependent receptor domain-containing protein [Sphingomonas sp. H160509]|uniref:TonB-dependent receptor domain-containing protein n=1 Tax=Sphingomonas sp. H160509 TaxID=2955313 RepID=UPI003158E271